MLLQKANTILASTCYWHIRNYRPLSKGDNTFGSVCLSVRPSVLRKNTMTHEIQSKTSVCLSVIKERSRSKSCAQQSGAFNFVIFLTHLISRNTSLVNLSILLGMEFSLLNPKSTSCNESLITSILKLMISITSTITEHLNQIRNPIAKYNHYTHYSYK